MGTGRVSTTNSNLTSAIPVRFSSLGTFVAEFYRQILIKTLSAPYEIEGNQVAIGASVGIALSPGTRQSLPAAVL